MRADLRHDALDIGQLERHIWEAPDLPTIEAQAAAIAGVAFERTVHIPGTVSNYHEYPRELPAWWTLTVYHDEYLADAAKYAHK